MANESNNEAKDISMVDVSNALNEVENHQEYANQPPVRRKSTLLLTDEDVRMAQMNDQYNDDKMHIDKSQTNLNQLDTTSSSSMSQGPSSSSTGSELSKSQEPQTQPNGQSQLPAQNEPDLSVTVPVEIKWTQGGEKVYVTGSFTGWRKMIGLAKQPDNSFLITLGLPIGTHRFRFVIDNELRFSDYLPTATDQMGNFVNYVEVTPENVHNFLEQQEQSEDEKSEIDSQVTDDDLNNSKDLQQTQQKTNEPNHSILRKSSISRSATRSDSMWGLTNDDDDMGNGYSRYHDEDGDPNLNKDYQFITDIPPIFIDPKVMEQYYIAIEKQSKSQNGQQAWLHPPQLPPHLENVILNNFNSMDRDNNSGALPIPNHVVLNHLATTSIKHNTLSVASIVRYKRKYVTQVLYAPLQQ